MDVFAERGYDAASIAEIADAAGVAGSVIYHHFGSKAGLWTSVLEAENRRLVERVAAAVADRGIEGRRLPAGVDAYFGFVEEHRAAWRLLVRAPPADPRLREVHTRLQDDREQGIVALYQPPKVSVARGRKKAQFSGLLAAAIRTFASWWDENPEIPRALIVDAVVAFSDSAASRLFR